MTEEKQYLMRGQASEYCLKKGLPVSPKTLAKYACVGGCPRYSRQRESLATEMTNDGLFEAVFRFVENNKRSECRGSEAATKSAFWTARKNGF